MRQKKRERQRKRQSIAPGYIGRNYSYTHRIQSTAQEYSGSAFFKTTGKGLFELFVKAFQFVFINPLYIGIRCGRVPVSVNISIRPVDLYCVSRWNSLYSFVI